MTNKVYDVLKQIAQIWIPALSVLYVGLAEIWNLPLGQEVALTLAAIDTFLGAVLHISTNNYNNGDGVE